MKKRSATPTRRRVFIIDDHALVREWLASLVSREADLEICGQAETAVAALAALPRAQPEVVVADLSLGDSSGLEMIKDIRAQNGVLAILVLSMHEDPSVAERAFRAGARGYVVKRESGARVIEAIREVLAGRFYASPALAAQLAGRLAGASGNHAGSVGEKLSDRELEVFQLRGEGRRTAEIAKFLRVSVKTVESYDARIKEKLGLESSAELMREAVRWIDRKRDV